MSPLLPQGSQTTFAELADLIPRFDLASAAPTLRVRTLTAKTKQGALAHYGTVLRFEQGDTADSGAIRAHRLGSVELLEHVRTTPGVVNDSQLHHLLGFWASDSAAKFQGFSGDPYAQWYPSRGPWHVAPAWAAFAVGEGAATVDASQFLDGPVVDEDLRFFAPTLEATAVAWLGGQAAFAINRYWMVFPDLRARIADIEVQGSELRIQVQQRANGPLICAAYGQTYDSEPLSTLGTVKDGEVRLDLGRVPRSLEVYLFDAQRQQADRFSESQHGSSWGRSVLVPRRGKGGPTAIDLDEALESGEGQRVEFKPLVLGGKGDHRSDAKLQEILETVVAFANAEGGDLYLGVDDRGSVVGTLAQVQRDTGNITLGDAKKAVDFFAGDVRKMIAEGIAPSIQVTMEWVERAEHLVLRVGVPVGTERPYYVIDQTRYFVRRGATNRPMPPEEFDRIYRERTGRY